MERKIQSWDWKSRSRLLSEGPSIPSNVSRIVLAGVAEMAPLAERACTDWGGPVTVLIGAPETEAENFTELGRPDSSWSERELPTPSGALTVVADPRQQAIEALRVVAESGTPSDQVVIGSADTEVGDELARTFSREGWIAFHPAASPLTTGLHRWLKIWSRWLADPTLAAMADLLELPETGILVSGKRAGKARTLSTLRDRWMVIRSDDLQRRIAAETFRKDRENEEAQELCEAAASLEKWRGSMLGGDFSGTLSRLLAILSKTSDEAFAMAGAMQEWLDAAQPLMDRIRRGPAFWIDLMLSETPAPPQLPPTDRVLDVQGWLELFHEPGPHLVLCGMNEGKVPGRSGGEPWLSESSRKLLGLIMDSSRAARDAYLYQAMIMARKQGGRVDVFCGKAGSGGEPLLPSRLLLAAGREMLPDRVRLLFKEIEPPEAGLRWHADWQWKPLANKPMERLNVTSLGSYLECPFRYYLKHARHMQSPEPDRAEWNARDFGTVAHEVLERWGRDLEARESSDAVAIHSWLSASLDTVVVEWFGKRVPLSIRIQTEALRQRFVWLARVQAANRLDGWEVVDVERKVEIPVGDAVIVAKIDRIDIHSETGRYRVLDYKTGKVDSVDKAHRKKITPHASIPTHLGRETPAIYDGETNGKSTAFLWHNLQLPLYAAALVQRELPLPTPCYFTLRSTEAEVAIHEWKDFDAHDLEAARECADWVAGQIAAGIFWPPAEKVVFDDFADLTAGRQVEEMFSPPPPLLDPPAVVEG